MQIDFHYYTVYTLCRLAGIKDEYSKKIAYSSQQVDDAKYDHVLEFQSGGRFEQQLSAHKFLDLGVLSKSTSYDIFLPFHFLPGIEGETFYEKLICRQNSKISKEMLKDTLKTLDKPYGLHRLGIALHVYADTWSHQNFHGLFKKENDVDELELINGLDDSEALIWLKAKFIPAIGHGQAYIYPDEPYLIWRYIEYNMKEKLTVNNQYRAMDAVYHIYYYLSNEVKRKKPEIYEGIPRKWRIIENKIRQILINRALVDERVKLWQEQLKNGFFGFRVQVEYNDREWFKEAVNVIDADKKIYDKNENFYQSDWKYFQDALILHRFHIRNELLPKYGIIT
ncbi:MAG: hypothetical protein N4A64_08325 [Marinisporobacter sp.]|jgi:hypothetical protein|nr:hypothetical protein [Marinisporobacter sp.]